ncbi:MAG: TonB-dependent receptor, partial [Prevotellaceae bacterium]|nr:TonB-dependent receptor [Prevotellaceae bacterium]
GASVSEKGTTNGVITDSDGNFSISVQGGDAVLQISYVGYVTQDVAVGNRTVINVTLLDDTQALDEVVVVGYGTQKKVNLSGAVATVSAKALENRPVTNANLALQGLAPGMNISMSDGRATTAPDINIRGYTSINGGSAFILVDNVPVGPNELSRINPSDIESVSVLQDAAASAIYGARAAFGVVLITTKTAKNEKLQVDFDANYGIRQIYNIPDLVTDPYLFMQYTYESGYPLRTIFSETQRAYAKQRSEDPSLPEIIMHPNDPNLWDYYASTNWLDEVYRKTTPTYTANVRIAQKTDKLSYAMSGGYYQQNGVLSMANDVMKRYNFRGNGTYKLTDWWKLGSNLSFVTSNYDSPSILEHDFYGKIKGDDSIFPVYNPDGTYTSHGSDGIGFLKDGGRTQTNVNETQLSLNTSIDLWKDVWTIEGDVNFRRTNTGVDKAVMPVYYRTGPEQGLQIRGMDGSTPYAEVRSTANNYTVLNLYTNFRKTFADKHFVHALVGFNQEYLHENYFWTRKQQLITSSLPTIQLATGTVTNGQSINELALRGLFFRFNYIFDNKYILEFNGRRDGTSRYPKDSRWGFFPSASAAWIVSNEKFFSGVNDLLQISNLKLRGSYGTLGNQTNSSYYPYIATMGSGNIGRVLDGGQPMAVYQPGTVAGNLTWETVRTVNGGVDLGLFKNKLNLTFNKYTRYTEGMLTKSKELPGFYGAGEPATNAADLKTKGWELSVGYADKVNVAGSPLSFGVRFMLWDSRTWITKYDNPNRTLSAYYEGQEIGEIWGLHTVGYFASDEEVASWADQTKVGGDDTQYKFYKGDLKFADLNGDNEISFGKSTVDDPGDRTIIGNSSSRFPYSIEANAEWKGFDLRVFFQGVGQRDWYPNNGHGLFWGVYATPWTTPIQKNLDHWTPENPNGYFPRMKQYIAEDNSELGTAQTKYLQNASYLRLKNLTLGYTLPKSLTDKWKIDRLRVYFSGENLWTIHNIAVKEIDPENLNGSGHYPMQKVWSVGINLSF